MVAQAEDKKQDALRSLREAELRATQITQASADAEKIKVQAGAQAEAEAIKLRTIAGAQADAIRMVNQAIAEGGDSYLALRQLEMIPQIAPVIANALAQARMVTISSDGKGASGETADQITGVIQTILAAQLVQTSLNTREANVAPTVAVSPALPSTPVTERSVTTERITPVVNPASAPPRINR